MPLKIMKLATMMTAIKMKQGHVQTNLSNVWASYLIGSPTCAYMCKAEIHRRDDLVQSYNFAPWSPRGMVKVLSRVWG